MAVSSPATRECSTLASMDEAEDLYAELNDACLLIQAQLSDKDHHDGDGNRLSDHAYHQWRSRATWALAQKRIQMGKVKRWITARKHEAARIEAGIENPSNVVELFGALMKIAKCKGRGEPLTAQEAAVLTLAERWIRVKGAPAVVAAREQAEVAS